jgi:hypothetical protein
MKKAIERRPTEALSGIALGTAVYGFLTQYGVPTGIAAGAGAVVAFGPAVVSGFVDALGGGSR